MLTALTQRAALTAHVGKALKEMGLTVQVNSIFYTFQVNSGSVVIKIHDILLQMFLSVTEVLIIVIRMQCVSTHLEDLGVCVTLGSLEMELHAQVITLLVPNLHPLHHSNVQI